MKKENLNVVPTGATLLDLVIGGGNQWGKIINVVGDKSSGKTLLAMETIAAAKQKFKSKLKWYYDDAEAGLSFDTKQLYGFDMRPVQEKDGEEQRSYTIEEFDSNLEKELNKLKSDEMLIYVLDSLDSLTSFGELKRVDERRKALEKGNEPKGSYQMEKQKGMSEFFRIQRKKINDKNCLLIIVSQVRCNIGVMFGPKYIRTGGKALDFYAAVVLWLAEAEKHDKKGRCIGVTIKAKTTKCKIAPPFRETYLVMYFDYGVDNLTSNLQYLFDLYTPLGKLKKKAPLEWEGIEYKSLPILIQFIETNNLEKQVAEKVQAKWAEIEESVSSKDRKKRF